MSLFLLPVIASLFSAVAFWVGVFPCAHFARWFGNQSNLSTWWAGFVAVGLSALIGGIFGQFSGGLYAASMYALFLGLAAIAFWWTTARRTNVDPLSAAGPAGG
jgi:hypothetical protein